MNAKQKLVNEMMAGHLKEISNVLVAGFTGLVLFVVISGCTNTVAPKPVVNKTIAWSGNVQNAGVLGFLPDGGLHIDSTARDRYNGLVALQPDFKKSGLVLPLPAPIPVDFGITKLPDGTFEMTLQAAKDFAVLERWFHQAQTK